MDRFEVKDWMGRARAELGEAQTREEVLAARAVVLARHLGRLDEHGRTKQLAEQTGLAWATVDNCFAGRGQDASYDALAEVCGLTLAALDREAEAIVARSFRRRALKSV